MTRFNTPSRLTLSDFTPSDIRRFVSMVEVCDATGCWVWTGWKNPKGYGRFWTRDGTKRAHRCAIAIFNAEAEPCMHVHHRCFNPSCVNPAHLECMDEIENSRLRQKDHKDVMGE